MPLFHTPSAGWSTSRRAAAVIATVVAARIPAIGTASTATFVAAIVGPGRRAIARSGRADAGFRRARDGTGMRRTGGRSARRRAAAVGLAITATGAVSGTGCAAAGFGPTGAVSHGFSFRRLRGGSAPKDAGGEFADQS
jgi:hypothetical protein